MLLYWIIHDNVAFHKINSERFRRLLIYINRRVQSALPSAHQLREWVIKNYYLHKKTVMLELRNSIGLIHISFDLWNSGNLVSLNGIVAYYHTIKGEPRTILLALPEHENEHSGPNIAASVAVVIEAFGIQDRIGYFILDNAGNNDTAMDDLCERFDLDWNERRLRCMGHVINLIAKQLLLGKDIELLELELNKAAAEDV